MDKCSIQQIDKKLVEDSFRASGPTYEEKAVVQKLISRQLVTYLGAICDQNFISALEIGCCTGYLTEFLCHRFGVKEIYINDLVEAFCQQTCNRLKASDCNLILHPFPGDIESLLLPEGIDLVISSSTLQWMTDLEGLLKRIKCCLNDKGYLAISIFGQGTMKEISSLTGRGLQYCAEETLQEIVTNEFEVELFTTDTNTLYFPSVRSILRHIQQTGVGGVGQSRWTKSSLKSFENQYQLQFGSDKGLPVTYLSHYIVAKKS